MQEVKNQLVDFPSSSRTGLTGTVMVRIDCRDESDYLEDKGHG